MRVPLLVTQMGCFRCTAATFKNVLAGPYAMPHPPAVPAGALVGWEARKHGFYCTFVLYF